MNELGSAFARVWKTAVRGGVHIQRHVQVMLCYQEHEPAPGSGNGPSNGDNSHSKGCEAVSADPYRIRALLEMWSVRGQTL